MGAGIGTRHAMAGWGRWLAARLRPALVALACLATPALAADRVALVVGNNAYRHAPALANAINDAKLIAGTLRGAGFEVIEAYDADSAALDAQSRIFADKAKAARIGLIYFAGHGIQFQGTSYIIPIDVDLADERDLRRAIPSDYLLADASRAADLGVVILDACRDNPFVKQIAETVGATRSVGLGRGLSRIGDVPKRTLLAYATQADKVALDATPSSGDNSPFAAALAKHIATPGKDVRLVFGEIRDEVVRLTEGKQDPPIYASLGGDELALVPADAAAAGPSPAVIPTAAPAAVLPATTAIEPGVAIWQAALTSSNWSLIDEAAAAKPTDPLVATALLLRRNALTAPSLKQAIEIYGSRLVDVAKLDAATVATLQAGLRSLNYYSAAIDGKAGPQFREALQAFARDEGAGEAISYATLVRLGERAGLRSGTSELAGRWRGRYFYSNSGQPSVEFALDLAVSQGLVTGFVSEPNTFGDKTSNNLYADISGRISGRQIRWIKTYDGTAGVSHSVEYAGTIDRKARRIEGQWRIGNATGTFNLTRE